jgi:alkyldihydroxyacetonephosphate synthase
MILRNGSFKRVADVVIYPESHEQVEKMVHLANKHDVVLVAYGGGTNVTNSLQLSTKEKRMIVSVDMARLSKIKWVDKVNNLACIEAGIVGQDLERELKNYGVCLGHEPVRTPFYLKFYRIPWSFQLWADGSQLEPVA